MKIKLFILFLFLFAFQGNARIYDIYLKNLIDTSDLIIVGKIIDISIKDKEADKAEIRVLSVIKGDSISGFKLNFHPTWHADIMSVKMGETGIFFLRKKGKNNFENLLGIEGRFSSKLIKNERYAVLSRHVIFPLKYLNNIIMQPMDNGHFQTIDRYVQLDTLKKIITGLISEPPLLRINCFMCPSFPIPPNEFEVAEFINKNKTLSNIDKVAIYDGIYNPGLDSNVLSFLLGEPDNTFKNTDETFDWAYHGVNNVLFRFKDGRLISLININMNKNTRAKK
jgi:hypothetical protein